MSLKVIEWHRNISYFCYVQWILSELELVYHLAHLTFSNQESEKWSINLVIDMLQVKSLFL